VDHSFEVVLKVEPAFRRFQVANESRSTPMASLSSIRVHRRLSAA